MIYVLFSIKKIQIHTMPKVKNKKTHVFAINEILKALINVKRNSSC